MREISTDHPMQGTPASGLAVLWHLLRAMRPRQWIKNIFIFPAIVFSEERLWTEPNRILTVCLAFVAFCMAASAIYLVNDLVDIEKDRAHPRKRNRTDGRICGSPAASLGAYGDCHWIWTTYFHARSGPARR